MKKRELVFTLTRKPRTKLNRFQPDGQCEAELYDTAEEGQILGVHYCPCHDFWPYTPKALMEAVERGTVNKIVCCFPADAKRRHPYLAPYILGDWEGVTMTERGCGECEECIASYELGVRENEAMTRFHYIQQALGIDHMAGKVPRYDPLKKAA